MEATPSDRLLARLSRITTSGRFIPQIDGLRFVAIAMVVVVHVTSGIYASVVRPWANTPATDLVWRFAKQGPFGVELFFGISGFILAVPFASHWLLGEKPVSLRKYYLRRLTRLEPPYLLALMLSLAAVAVLYLLFPYRPADAPDLVGTVAHRVPDFFIGIFYLHGPVYGVANPLNLVFWSLEVEVQFYLLMPLLARVFRIQSTVGRRLLIVGAAVAAVAVQNTWLRGNERLLISLVGHIQFFLMGFLVADLFLVGWPKSSRTYRWDIACLAVLGLGLWLRMGPEHAGPAWVYPVLVLVLLAVALRGTIAGAFLGNRWIYTIGGMCYSIYLIHVPVIQIVRKETLKAVISPTLGVDLLIQLALVTPVVLLAGALYFVAIERPCMDPQWWSRWRSRTTTRGKA